MAATAGAREENSGKGSGKRNEKKKESVKTLGSFLLFNFCIREIRCTNCSIKLSFNDPTLLIIVCESAEVLILIKWILINTVSKLKRLNR